MKFALVSRVLPPSSSGQAVMIYRLLRGLHPDNYCLISVQNYAAPSDRNEYSGRLSGRYYHLFPQFQLTRGHRFGLNQWRSRINVLLSMPGIVWRGSQIARILRRENCDAVVACTGELLDLPAAYLASRLVGIPFYPYIFDYYSYQWTEPTTRYLAQRLERILLSKAAGVIVPNEFLRDELRVRYGVEATVIHNPCEIAEYEAISNDPPTKDGDEIRIVYTGAIYAAHYDAFRNLLTAIELLGRSDLKLHLYSDYSRRDLEENGIRGPVVHHEYQAASVMPTIQRQASLLFLPLAFNSPYPEVIKTSAPGKMGEYLAARRPILVHAPSNSFVAWYFRHHECGLVVDRTDPEQLVWAIEQVLTDASLRQRLSIRAWERAQSDYSIAVAQATFAQLMKLTVPDN